MMFSSVSLLTATLTAILTVLSSAEHDEQQLAIADLSIFSNIPPSAQHPNEVIPLPSREGEQSKQDWQTLDERAIGFGWYSRTYKLNNLRQWIFGNATNQFNISISTCIHQSDVAGFYEFMDGTNSTNATFGDIYTDLGYGTALANQERMLAHTLLNAQAAFDEISTFLLDSILCSGTSPVADELRRQLLFASEGRVMTLILQGSGALISYFLWNGIGLAFENPGVKILFGGIATLQLVIVVGLLEILRQEGRIEPYETALIGAFYVARARMLIMRMRLGGRANQAAGPCLPETQMTAAVATAGSGSAPAQDLGVAASADVSEIQAACAANQS